MRKTGSEKKHSRKEQSRLPIEKTLLRRMKKGASEDFRIGKLLNATVSSKHFYHLFPDKTSVHQSIFLRENSSFR